MEYLTRSDSGPDCYYYSNTLKKKLSPFTDDAFAIIDNSNTNLCLRTTKSQATNNASISLSKRHAQNLLKHNTVVNFSLADPSDLPAGFLAGPPYSLVFRSEFEDGSVDFVAINLKGGHHDKVCVDVLSAMWPVIREDCLQDALTVASDAVASALLWTISKKSDSAVLVLNASGRILHANESGAELLEQQTVLKEIGGTLSCKDGSESKALLNTLKECARDTAAGREYIIFLGILENAGRLPVSLTRFSCAMYNEPLIVAIMPKRPEPKRVEMLAREMGLTPAEARVAALMQLGLSNREAAPIAGLKEQTFSTYSKRVLSKLNAGCRAEVANMLTWQASLGRAS